MRLYASIGVGLLTIAALVESRPVYYKCGPWQIGDIIPGMKNPVITATDDKCVLEGVPAVYVPGQTYKLTVKSTNGHVNGYCQLIHATGGVMGEQGGLAMPNSLTKSCRYNAVRSNSTSYIWSAPEDLGDITFSALCGHQEEMYRTFEIKSVAAEIARPNIMIIAPQGLPFASGQVGAPTVPSGMTSYKSLLMSTLEKLQSEGGTFRKAYSAEPNESANRFSILTGRYCSASEYARKTSTAGIDADQCYIEGVDKFKNIQNVLKGVGYKTGFSGVWGLTAEGSGVDRAQWTDYADVQAEIRATGFDHAEGVYFEAVDTQHSGSNTHNLEWQTEAALNFFDSWTANNTGKPYYEVDPFFYYFAPSAPQAAPYSTILQNDIRSTPAGTLSADPVSGMPSRQSVLDRAASHASGTDDEVIGALWLDDAIKSVTDKLVDLSVLDNTIFVIVSANNPGNPGSLFDSGSRLVYTVRYPRLFDPASEFDQIVSTVDLTPSLVELVSAQSLYKPDGESWVAYARRVKAEYLFSPNDPVPSSEKAIIGLRQRYPRRFMIERGQFRASLAHVYDKVSASFKPYKYMVGETQAAQASDATWYASFSSATEILVDLESDETEQTNLIGNSLYSDIESDFRVHVCEYLRQATKSESSDGSLANACAFVATAAPTITAPPPTPDGGNALREPMELKSEDGKLDLTLEVRPHRHEGIISYNTRAFYYNNQPMIPGPTLRIRPGDVVTLTIVNSLEDGPFPLPVYTMNQLNLPNITNIHTHGLHIAPEVDSIFIKILPGETYTYTYKIPYDHPSGLFWYHTHHHGSVTYQMMGGLLGCIFVEPREPTKELPSEIVAMDRKILCLTHLKMEFTSSETQKHFSVLPYKVMAAEIKDGIDAAPTYTVPGLVDVYLTNGQYQPKLTMGTGEKKVFDIVNAVGGPVLEVEIRDAAQGGNPACSMQLLALDGVYLQKPRDVEYIVFLPATRASIVVHCSTAGTFYLQTLNGGVSGTERPGLAQDVQRFTQTLLEMEVSGAVQQMDSPTETSFGIIPRPKYFADLSKAKPDSHFELSLQSSDFMRGAPAGYNWMGMGTNCSLACGDNCYNDVFVLEPEKCVHEAWHMRTGDLITGPTYRYTTKLFSIEEMVVNNIGDMHPLHVHVSHFQLLGYEPSPGASKDVFDFYGEVGDWRDTFPSLSGRVLTRFRPERFDGEIVAHCHHVVHEDRGMMGVFYVDDYCPISTPMLPLYTPGIESTDMWWTVMLANAFSFTVSEKAEIASGHLADFSQVWGYDRFAEVEAKGSFNRSLVASVFLDILTTDQRTRLWNNVSDLVGVFGDAHAENSKITSDLYLSKCGAGVHVNDTKVSILSKVGSDLTAKQLNVLLGISATLTQTQKDSMNTARANMTAYTISGTFAELFGSFQEDSDEWRVLNVVASNGFTWLTGDANKDKYVFEERPGAYFGLENLKNSKTIRNDQSVYELGTYVLHVLPKSQRDKLDNLHASIAPLLISYIRHHRSIVDMIRSATLTSTESTDLNTTALLEMQQKLNEANIAIAKMCADVFSQLFLSMCPSQVNYLTFRVSLAPKTDTCPSSCPVGCLWERYSLEGLEGILADSTSGPVATNSSCQGRCHLKATDQSCWCDEKCHKNNDCCADKTSYCINSSAATGSCAGSCTGKSANGNCYCDKQCSVKNDCCADFAEQCESSCSGFCGTKPKSNFCRCDVQCKKYGDCCPDFETLCPDLVLPTGSASCVGNCGDKHPDAACYCDKACAKKHDCCEDVASACPATQVVGSCLNSCGNKTSTNGGTCYCDRDCEKHKDCCLDKDSQCGASS